MALNWLSGPFPPTARIRGLPVWLLIHILLLPMLLQARREEATAGLTSDLNALWEDADGEDGDNVAQSSAAAPIAGCCADRVLAGLHQVGVMTQHDAVPSPRTPSLAARSPRAPSESAGR